MKAALCLLALACSSLAEEVKVKTDKGVVKGIREDGDKGEYYYAFKGVRYAAPPVENLRFKVGILTSQFGGKKLCTVTDVTQVARYLISFLCRHV